MLDVSPEIMARDFLGLAVEEFRVAHMEETVGNTDDNIYARNKALQSAGIGIELVYKALILAQGEKPVGSRLKGHLIKALHRQLALDDKDLLETRIRDVGWPTASHWCRYMDETLNHVQRRYLMYDVQLVRQGVTFPTDGAASVSGIKLVFDRAFELADKRVSFSSIQHSRRELSSPKLPDGIEIGPVLAEINLSKEAGRGGLEFDPRTGEVRFLKPHELEPGNED